MRCVVPLLLAGLQLGAGAGVSRAQAVRGIVIEVGTRGPVSAAEVVVLDASSREQGRALTDSVGGFRIRVPGEGRYAVRVTHAAYMTYLSDGFGVGAAETVSVEVRLGQAVVPLDPLVVTARSSTRLAEFHERRTTNAFGRFITREDIERRASPRTTDLLRGMPGVSITPVRVRGRTSNLISMRGTMGGCEPAIYVDGLPVRQNVQSTMDEILPPDVIAGVEVYTSSAGAPARFTNPTGCGTILFWTRTGDEAEGRRLTWTRAAVGVAALGLILLLVR